MSRYARMFELLRTRGEGAFGAFLMLGDPDLQRSALLLDALVEAGMDAHRMRADVFAYAPRG